MGKTGNEDKRQSDQNNVMADDVELSFVLEVDDISAVESCAKLLLKKCQYRNRKEVYITDEETIKNVIIGCNNTSMIVKKYKNDNIDLENENKNLV